MHETEATTSVSRRERTEAVAARRICSILGLMAMSFSMYMSRWGMYDSGW